MGVLGWFKGLAEGFGSEGEVSAVRCGAVRWEGSEGRVVWEVESVTGSGRFGAAWVADQE